MRTNTSMSPTSGATCDRKRPGTGAGFPTQHGMSLIEILVGIVIGMLTVLVVANTIAVSEGQRRGTSTGADAQASATVATYIVERDLRMAGYGLFSNEANGISQVCTTGVVRMYNQNRTPSDFNFDVSLGLAPFLINPAGLPAGDPQTDVLLINYTGAALGAVSKGVPFEQQSGASANYKVTNRAGFSTGDLVMAVQPGKDCTVAEVTGLPGDPKCSEPGSQTMVVIHNNGQYSNSYKNCSKVDATWNKPGGLGITYTAGMLYNLGPPDQMVSVAYAVRGGRLTRCNLLTDDCQNGTKTTDPLVWQPIADDVVLLRAEMGLDLENNGSVETWRTQPCAAAGCTPTFTEWSRLRLGRIAIVARSAQFEKEDVTTAQPKWQGQVALKVDHLADWKRYRYATTEVVVPIRNVIWGSSL